MTKAHQLNLLKLFLVITLTQLTLAQERRRPSLSELLPHIQSDNYELVPSGDLYRLRLAHPDGGQRVEVVELRAPGTAEQELRVTGASDSLYADNGAYVVILYEAGKNGYFAKVKYSGAGVLIIKPPTIEPQFISAGGLKSAAG